MMVETILESSQDFGMSNGALPQWKRELLQRRAARVRPAPAPAPPPPPPPPLPPQPDDEDEELRYGPGIVKRLKSRYLSLALRDAPRRRPSVLRRAASLEHLLDERPPPAPRPARAPRPASVAAAPALPVPAHPRRDLVKRARSVDALSRLEEVPSPPPPPLPAARTTARNARPPRRPAPLLRDTERPPPDVVKSTLRKFETAPLRRPAPAARVSAVLRGLEAPRRSVTPEREDGGGQRPSSPPAPPPPTTPPPRLDPSPPPSPAVIPPKISKSAAPVVAPTVRPPPVPVERPVSPAVACPSSPAPSPSPIPSPQPPVAPVSPVAPLAPRPLIDEPDEAPSPRRIDVEVVGEDEFGAKITPSRADEESPRHVSRAALEGIARAGSSVRFAFETPRAASHLPPLAAANPVLVARRVGVIRPMPAARAEPAPTPAAAPAPPLANGHARGGRTSPPPPARPPWQRPAARPRPPPDQATSVVFNFSDRKEVPDYIENDGIVLRGSRRTKVKAGESGVVVLRVETEGEGEGGEESGGEGEERLLAAPPSPLAVRFVNDNVLINGRSSMPARPDRARHAKLKLQFDDSLTQTFEYPPEAWPEPEPEAEPGPEDAAPRAFTDNTHIASAALSRYSPSKTCSSSVPLGLAPQRAPDTPNNTTPHCGVEPEPQPAEAAPWSQARARATDLLF